MSRDRVDPDSIAPAVTFGSYVIPETVAASPAEPEAVHQPVFVDPPHLPDPEVVTYAAAPRAASRISPMMFAAATIALLMFFLGVLLTLQFSGSDPAPVAVVDPTVGQDRYALSQGGASATFGETEVSRAQSPDILTVPAAQAAPSKTSQAKIEALQAAVLRGLSIDPSEPKLTEEEKVVAVQRALEILSRNKLRMLREGVLAGVYTVETRKEGTHDRIVLKTVNADLTSQTMATVLHQAAKDGIIQIPASISTSDGDVDMDTMIFNLVQTSLMRDGTMEASEAAREMSRRAFAAAPAKTRRVEGEQVYVVEAGDSLAYISLQFYGRPSDYGRIFEANRNILSSPDKIQIGQRLIIPG